MAVGAGWGCGRGPRKARGARWLPWDGFWGARRWDRALAEVLGGRQLTARPPSSEARQRARRTRQDGWGMAKGTARRSGGGCSAWWGWRGSRIVGALSALASGPSPRGEGTLRGHRGGETTVADSAARAPKARWRGRRSERQPPAGQASRRPGLGSSVVRGLGTFLRGDAALNGVACATATPQERSGTAALSGRRVTGR